MNEKKLMIGNEAVARGLYEAGVRFVSSYPGTPSTEVTEFAAKYDEVYAEWAPNEKVALEAAFGASLAGVRSFCAMKHVGLNVAADPLFTASYTGVNAGLVILVADDMGMHSSQNEQDSRNHAISAKLPMLEPADSAECLEYVKKAFVISETFDTPVLVRTSTRVAHSQSIVSLGERENRPQAEYKKNPMKYVMMPAMAKKRHVEVEKRTLALADGFCNCPMNRVENPGRKKGVVTAGIAYQYAVEALGDEVSILKLGTVNPLPEKLIREFASSVEELYVIEELDPVIERQIKAMGISVSGKELFSPLGEYSAAEIARKLLGRDMPEAASLPGETDIPMRPPVLCPGCPHRGVFYILNKLGVYVSGDIGCYTLGALAPLNAIDMCLCMGASVSALHGFDKAAGVEKGKSVAVIGDSTFIHSGITGLVNIVYNQGNSTVIILDNHITGMTGHQQNPSTGLTLKNTPTYVLDLEALCRAVGVEDVTVTDPYDLTAFEDAVKAALAHDGASVVIARRPCALLKSVKAKPALKVDADKCRSCRRCMKLGCPCISIGGDGKAAIDTSLCTGCGLCPKVCPFGAIIGGESK